MDNLTHFLRTHLDNWEEILTQSPYNLTVKKEGNFVLFKYNQVCSDFSLPEVREARGIIYNHPDKNLWSVACRPFVKFFNYGEPNAAELDWEGGVSITEKIDGSLMKLWYFNGEWRLSTNGTIDAFKTEINGDTNFTFGDLFLRAVGAEDLDSFAIGCGLFCNVTYCFELVSPHNRIVIPYSEAKVYFLAAFDTFFGDEIRGEDYALEQNILYKVSLPKTYSCKCLEDVVAMAKELPWDEEGYVCADMLGSRIKVKSPEYVKAHYLRTNGNISNKGLIEVILSGGLEFDEFSVYCSDYMDRINDIINFMGLVEEAMDTARKALSIMVFKNRRDYAETVKKFPKVIQDYLFRWNDKGITPEEYVANIDANKWERMYNEGTLFVSRCAGKW